MPADPGTAEAGPRGAISCGLIGLGRIGRRIAAHLPGSADAPRLVAVLVRPVAREAAARHVEASLLCTGLDAFLARRPTVAVECASAGALLSLGPRLLAAGVDLMPLSLAALADRDAEARLLAAARRGPGRIEIPAGAMGSIGILAAAREDGLTRVRFRAAYPPAAWAGTPAAERSPPSSAARVVFRGSVREAAAAFPRHVNVSVAVALAGLGLDRTEAELIADPALTQAAFTVEIEAGPGRVRLCVSGRNCPVGEDPADYTAFSVLRLLRRRQAPLML